jgi:hypothetical protein
MGIGDIRRPCLRQQQPGSRGVKTIQRNDVRVSLPDQPGKTRLSRRVTHRLSQRRSRNDNAYPKLRCPCQQNNNPAIVPVERD